MKKLLEIYVTFLKIGAFTIGGGYAMIPIITRAVEQKKWATDTEMADFITIGQSLPGVVGINTATAVGKKAAGFWGALFAVLGMITPSVVIIILLALAVDTVRELQIVQRAFMGVRACVAALIVGAVVKMFKTSVKSAFQIVLFTASFLLVVFVRVPPPYMVVLCGILGAAYGALPKKAVK
ncbi:chromate transporter [Clostridia bacterium]|nr:chromate transporter [Clostridia bacterium]